MFYVLDHVLRDFWMECLKFSKMDFWMECLTFLVLIFFF